MIRILQKMAPPTISWLQGDVEEEELKAEDRLIEKGIFDGWVIRGNKLIHVADSIAVKSFDAIMEGCVYALMRPGDSFSGYANVEAQVQTRDSVKSIQEDGAIPGFRSATVVFEPSWTPPQGFSPPPDSKWGFPVNPDALLINGHEWLIIEAKHNFTTSMYNMFQQKVEFLLEHKEKPWIFRSWQKPSRIIPVMSSVSKPSFAVRPNTIFLIRRRLRFVRL